jgi:hypothetical protein
MDDRYTTAGRNAGMTDQQIEHIYLEHRTAFQNWACRKFGLHGQPVET